MWSPDQVGWPKTVVPVPHPRVHERRLPLFDITGVFPHLLNDDLRNWGGYLSDLITFNLQATGETRLTEGLDVIAVQDWLSAIAGLSLAKDRKVPVVFHIHSAEWGRQPGGEAQRRCATSRRQWHTTPTQSSPYPTRCART